MRGAVRFAGWFVPHPMPAQPTPCCGQAGAAVARRVASAMARLLGPQATRRRLLPRLAALLSAVLGLAPALATPAADEPTGCSLLWQLQITTPRDGAAPQLWIDMAFDAGPRSRSALRLPGGWAGLQDSTGQGLPDSANTAGSAGPSRLQAVPDAPQLRTVAHAPSERVHLRWRYSGPTDAAQGGSVRLAPGWFALAGLAVLPVPEDVDERNPPSACVQLRGDDSGDANTAASTAANTVATAAATTAASTAPGNPASPAATRWASSHGQVDGPSALFRLTSTSSGASPPLRQRVQQALYAGGALERFQSTTDGLPLTLVRPSATGWLAPIGGLGQAAVSAWAAQRQFWGDSSRAAPLLLLLLPGGSPASGGAWHQALALQAPADLAWPGADADALLARALVSTWVPDRFGPLLHAGRSDEALRAWFSDGLAAHYSHRFLLRSGQWTADTYAEAMNQRITRLAAAPGSAAAQPAHAAGVASLAELRGELLALQWHAALRAAGHPGLDSVLQRLLLAPAQARHEGPISAPLATHRLVAALRPVLGDAPLRDIQRQAERAEPADLGPATLGPCFIGKPGQPSGAAAAGGASGTLMQYQPVPDALQQADCQGWLGLGPQALLAQASHSRLRTSTNANTNTSPSNSTADPDTAPAPRRAGKAAGLKKGKGLHRRSGNSSAKAAGSRPGASKASAGKSRTGQATGSKRAKPKASAKKAHKR